MITKKRNGIKIIFHNTHYRIKNKVKRINIVYQTETGTGSSSATCISPSTGFPDWKVSLDRPCARPTRIPQRGSG